LNGGLLAREDQLFFGLDLVSGTVFQTDLSGRVLRMIEFGSPSEASGVGGLTLDDRGFLYVADPVGQKLRVFDPEGVKSRVIGEERQLHLARGLQLVERDGVLEDPNDVAVDAEGNVYVACGEQFIVHGLQKFSAQGLHTLSFSSMGEPGGTFGGPRGLTLDPDGTLWLCDTQFHRLQRFEPGGRFLDVLGPPRNEPLVSPYAVTMLPDGDLLVAQSLGLIVLGRDDARRRPFTNRRLARVCDVCCCAGTVWILEREIGNFGIRVSRFDVEGNLLGVVVSGMRDLVGKASTWLKAEMGRSLPPSQAWHRLGVLYHYVLPETFSNLKHAERCYRKSLQAEPVGFEVSLDLAEVLTRRGRPEEAMRLHRECLEIRPEDESIRLRLALLLCQKGDKKQACQLLLDGLELSPESELLRSELDRLT
jgi:hypothetical protein